MTSPHLELADLVASLRSYLEEEQLRGVVNEAPWQPPAVTAEPPPAVIPEASAGAVTSLGAWGDLARSAREAPMAPGQVLRGIRDDLGDCRRCELCRGRRQIVFGVGDPESDLVVIGEGPGAQEDQSGEPFVGPAGQMLDKMLENVLGLSRQRGVYILNVVKCRPPKNRNPTAEEVRACLPYLQAQIEAIHPKLLLVLGSVAYRSLLDTPQGIKRNRGQWHTWKGIPVMPTFHPAYLLRQPQDKRLVFEDLKATRARYDALGGRR